MYEITLPKDETEPWRGKGNDISMLVDTNGRCFTRVAIKNVGGPATQVRWLVGELNGVRLYAMRDPGASGVTLILTTVDLYA